MDPRGLCSGLSHEVVDNPVSSAFPWNTSIGMTTAKRIPILGGIQFPAAPLFSAVPFGPEAGEYMAWIYFENGLDLYQEMYDQAGFNVKVFPCTIIAPETSGWFAEEITSAEQLDGLKMRFFGLGGKVMQKLGVATTLLPGGDIFPALEQGAIDATEFSMPAIDQRLGFDKLVKYNYLPGPLRQHSCTPNPESPGGDVGATKCHAIPMNVRTLY